ncbi:MAG: DNA translocase FtsK [Dysgonamonadaceae bacterium]|jgi:S-DNA-T family DNA segregation ATPase FtsK/SpoIIIE|nr:DNA translocase FtsK [Dysgonamonadaceae bacterium]
MAKKKVQQEQRDTSVFVTIKHFLKSDVTHFIVGLLILMFTVYTALSLISFFFTGAADQSKVEGLSIFHFGRISGIENWTGSRGACLSNVLMNEWFGISTFFLLLFLAFVGLRMMNVKYFSLLRSFILCSICMIWFSIAAAFFFGNFFKDTAIYIGGKHGFLLSALLVENVGKPGTIFILLFVLIIILIIISSRTIPFLRRLFQLRKGKKPVAVSEPIVAEPIAAAVPSESPVIPNRRHSEPTFEVNDASKSPTEAPVATPVDEESKPNKLVAELGVYDPKKDLSSYRYPTLDLLKQYSNNDQPIDMDEQNENKNKIIQTLDKLGIKIKSIKANVGPTITLYEIIQEDGIRISKIRNLEDDIAMGMAALGIRIIAPMPGKGTIGIEVPNKRKQIVSMYSIIASKAYQESKFDLPVALGKTITNDVFLVDLCKMPHLLVAGATGQGKSVGLNTIITSLLFKKHPAELKFVLIDPKMVEFNIYSVIEKHFLAKLPDAEKPIITDFTKVIHTLNSLTKEMDQRYGLLEKAKSRNIKEYNEKFINRELNPQHGHQFLPYIVVVIDEFGDLIMTAGKEIELPIARIAQKARAVGIHMVIATQRPTTNIITGTIKANFPARIAFRVTSMIDSRTILDSPGANQLIGYGDLLFFQGSDMIRVQCAFADTPEVERIVNFIGEQQGYPTAFLLPEFSGEESGGEKSHGSVDLSDRDPLFEEAARLIVIHQQGSTSLIQRKFSIGYNRAGRLMDQLEFAGIVGPVEGSKPRQIYIPDEYQLEQLLNTLK